MIDVLLVILGFYVGWFVLITVIWLMVAGFASVLTALDDPQEAREMLVDSFRIFPVMIGLCWPALFYFVPLGVVKLVRGR